MIGWWNGRSPRERAMLAAMAAALAAFGLWYGVYAPLIAARAAAETRFEAARAAEAQVRRSVARIRALRSATRPSQQAAALAPEEAIRTTAEAAGLSLERVEPDPSGGHRVAIDATSATVLFPWLATLQREHGLAAQTLTVVKGENGALRVDATLIRPGG